jgi:two-component sensor histidine kinase
MYTTRLVADDCDRNRLDLVFDEFNHRIQNLLTAIEAAVRQTQSSNVDDFRASLIAQISGLRPHYQAGVPSHSPELGLAQIIERTVHPHARNGARILTSGPDVQLDPDMALALHLVFHELAVNSNKYGALSSPSGCVTAAWKMRDSAGRKLGIFWSEEGGPEVERPRHRGFGLRLIKKALGGHGSVRLDFNPAGLACFMMIDRGRAAKRRHDLARAA